MISFSEKAINYAHEKAIEINNKINEQFQGYLLNDIQLEIIKQYIQHETKNEVFYKIRK